jgi:nicotinamide riboside kinase
MNSIQSWINLQYDGFRKVLKTKYSSNVYTELECMLKSFMSKYNQLKKENNEEDCKKLKEYIEKIKIMMEERNPKRYKILEKYYKID